MANSQDISINQCQDSSETNTQTQGPSSQLGVEHSTQQSGLEKEFQTKIDVDVIEYEAKKG